MNWAKTVGGDGNGGGNTKQWEIHNVFAFKWYNTNNSPWNEQIRIDTTMLCTIEWNNSLFCYVYSECELIGNFQAPKKKHSHSKSKSTVSNEHSQNDKCFLIKPKINGWNCLYFVCKIFGCCCWLFCK